MSGVAVLTDSAADLGPDLAARHDIRVVPLIVSFGDREWLTGVDLSTEEFWARLTEPGAPFPKTAAAPPGAFRTAFEEAFAAGADAVVYVGVSSRLSATVQSARIARDQLSDREVHVVDSETASMGVGMLALLAADRARRGASAAAIVSELERRRADERLYVVLETLEYLKRGGRISGARAAIGGVLSVKPIITITDGVVETADRPRTRGRARARLLELLAAEPVEQAWVIHGRAEGIETFADELAHATRLPRDRVGIVLIGSSVGPHVGPGAYGAVVLRAAS